MTAASTRRQGLEWVVSFASVWILLYTPPGIFVFALLTAIINLTAEFALGMEHFIPASMLMSFLLLVLVMRYIAVPIMRKIFVR